MPTIVLTFPLRNYADMIRFPIIPLLLAFLSGIPLSLHAHEVEVCLAKVAQKSGQLHACRIAQTDANQCDALAQQLEQFQRDCLYQYHPPEHVARATAYGAGQVEGDPDQSPYQQRLARERWEQSQIGPNMQRFSALFPEFDHFKVALAEHFGTQACPSGYEGRQDRWLHAGYIPMQRYSFSEGNQLPPVVVPVHFFAQEVAGRCYPVPSSAGGQSGSVINIPDQMLQELEKQGIAIRCKNGDCAATRDEVNSLYQQYQGAYREYRQLMMCADAAKRGGGSAIIKGAARPVSDLPEHCPKKEIDVAYLNARGLVEELEQQLFSPGKLHSRQAKATQN